MGGLIQECAVCGDGVGCGSEEVWFETVQTELDVIATVLLGDSGNIEVGKDSLSLLDLPVDLINICQTLNDSQQELLQIIRVFISVRLAQVINKLLEVVSFLKNSSEDSLSEIIFRIIHTSFDNLSLTD